MMAAGQLAIPRSRYRKIKSHRRFNVVRNSRGTSRERDMLFVPEARDAEITGVIRASRPLSHTNHMKWHDFPGAVLVIHRGGRKTKREREREREREERRIFQLMYVTQRSRLPPPHLQTAFLHSKEPLTATAVSQHDTSKVTNDTQ